MRKFVSVLALCMGVSVATAAEPPKDPPVIKIGIITAMSGKFDWSGKMHTDGARQAIEEINEAGGIGGVKLELVVEDHKTVPRDAVTAINKLSSVDGVQAVLTSFSAPSLAIAPIADDRGILLMNGGAVSQSMVGKFTNFFHNRSLASDLGKGVVSYAREMGYKRMAQLAWRNDSGESIIKTLGDVWNVDGETTVATEMIDPNAPNINTQVAKIRASNPDFVGLWLWSPDPGTAVKRFREIGVNVPLIGVEYTEDIQKIAGNSLEDYIFVSDHFQPLPEYPWSMTFEEGYKRRYGGSPHFYAANYYEAVYVMAELFRRAREDGGDYYHGSKLVEKLKENPVFDSVYGGTMTFQEGGVAAKRVGLFVVKNGAPEFQRYIEAQQ